MSMFKTLAMTALVAAGVATPASAVVTFATFSSATTTRNVRFISSEGTSSFISTLNNNDSTASAVPVVFSILGAPPVLQGVASTLTLDATIPSQSGGTDSFSLVGLTGSMVFTANDAVSYLGATGTNLLSVFFSDAALNGTIGGGTGGVTGSTVGGATISFTSDFLDFSGVTASDLSLSLSAIFSSFGNFGTPARLRNFRATLGGQFSSDPAPVLVPEPATWAMLVLGFGLVGVSVRRRRGVVVA